MSRGLAGDNPLQFLKDFLGPLQPVAVNGLLAALRPAIDRLAAEEKVEHLVLVDASQEGFAAQDRQAIRP